MFATFIAIVASVSLAIAAPTSVSEAAALAARAGAPPFTNVHPVLDGSKCVGIKGGIYANGTAVDM
jgi:hypothetical protein